MFTDISKSLALGVTLCGFLFVGCSSKDDDDSAVEDTDVVETTEPVEETDSPVQPVDTDDTSATDTGTAE